MRAQYKRDVAIVSANNREAVANAKLKAIQDSLVVEEIDGSMQFIDMEITSCKERTREWACDSYPERDKDLTPPTATHTHTHPLESHTPKDMHTPWENDGFQSQHTSRGRYHTDKDLTPRKTFVFTNITTVGNSPIIVAKSTKRRSGTDYIGKAHTDVLSSTCTWRAFRYSPRSVRYL